MTTFRHQQQADRSDFIQMQVMRSRARKVRDRKAYEARVRRFATRWWNREQSRQKRLLPTVPLESIMNRKSEPTTPSFVQAFLDAEDARNRLARCLDLLTPRERAIFLGYYQHVRPIGEIAKDSGLSKKGCYDLLRRCRERMLKSEDARAGL